MKYSQESRHKSMQGMESLNNSSSFLAQLMLQDRKQFFQILEVVEKMGRNPHGLSTDTNKNLFLGK